MVSPPGSTGPSRALHTSSGTNLGAFSTSDWILLAVVAGIWGSSFLWIAIALEGLHPGAVSFGRVLLGAAALGVLPSARRRIPRESWPALAVVAIAGNATPAVFFALAEQRVETSVAGMLNAVSPLMVLVISVGLSRKAPIRRQVVGLFVGFGGAILMAAPNLTGTDAQPLGLFFVGCAVFGYALSNNVIPPLQQAYGGAAVIANALVISSLVLFPYGVYGAGKSEADLTSIVALVVLGVVGTGMARAMFATLVGRVGAPRSSIMGYLVPVVAIVLGVTVRGEDLHALELVGTVVVLVGAWIISQQSPKTAAAS